MMLPHVELGGASSWFWIAANSEAFPFFAELTLAATGGAGPGNGDAADTGD